MPLIESKYPAIFYNRVLKVIALVCQYESKLPVEEHKVKQWSDSIVKHLEPLCEKVYHTQTYLTSTSILETWVCHASTSSMLFSSMIKISEVFEVNATGGDDSVKEKDHYFIEYKGEKYKCSNFVFKDKIELKDYHASICIFSKKHAKFA